VSYKQQRNKIVSDSVVSLTVVSHGGIESLLRNVITHLAAILFVANVYRPVVTHDPSHKLSCFIAEINEFA